VLSQRLRNPISYLQVTSPDSLLLQTTSIQLVLRTGPTWNIRNFVAVFYNAPTSFSSHGDSSFSNHLQLLRTLQYMLILSTSTERFNPTIFIVLRSQKNGKQSGEYEIGFALSAVNSLKFSTQTSCIAFVAS